MRSRGGLRFNPTGSAILILGMAILASVGISGCVTKAAGPSTVPAVAFQVLPPSALQTGAQIQLVALVANDSQNMGVNWTASCESTSCGTFNPPHTASGVATIYTAPTTVPQGCGTAAAPAPCVNLSAQAAAAPSQTSTVSINVFTSVAITLTGFPASPLGAGSTTTVTAVVTGDPTNAGVSWTLNCSAANCGTIPTNTPSGQAATYTAPSTVASSFVVTIQANAVAAMSQFVTTTVTVNPGVQASVSFTTPPTTPIIAGATDNIIATVSNDPTNAGVNWTDSCTNSTGGGCGTFNPGSPAHTASGAVMAYTAPTQIPSGGLQVTITAASAANPSSTVSATVTVNTATLSISFTQQPPTSLVVGTTAQMSANVQNDSPNPPNGVNWTVTCTPATGGTCGSFKISPAHTADQALITYTAPTIIPTGGTVTITATSAANSSVSTSQNITIEPSTAITIAFTTGEAPPATMLADATVHISATVTNDSTTPPNGVSWTVTCTAGTGGNCGSFNPTDTASGVETAYTAPTVLPANGTVTITATSNADTSATVSQNVTITSPQLTVTLSQPPPASMPVGTTASVTATVANDPTNSGVNWTCTASDGGNCGSFNPTATGSGVATTYTAPSAIPGDGGTVTITAASAAQPAVTATSNPVTITTDPYLALLKGQYVLSLSGTSTTGYYSLAGSITADGQGNITAGEEDIAGSSCGPATATSISGTYAIESDGRGTMTLNTGVSCFAPSNSGTQTFDFVIVGGPTAGSPRALIIEFDSASSSGQLNLQTSSASISGSYAFVSKGYDENNVNANGVSATDMGGIITVQSGTTLSFDQDTNDQGTGVVTKQQTASWSYTAPDSFGRGTATNAATSDAITFYVVNSGQIELLEDDSNFIESGSAFAEASSSSHLSGPFAFTLLGVNGSLANPVSVGGVFTASGTSLSNGVIDVNNGGTLTKDTSFSGSITGPSSGRGTFTLAGSPGGLSSFAYYPTASNGALILELDAGFVSTGAALPQSTTPTLGAGAYGMNLTNGQGGVPFPEEDMSGQVISDGVSVFTGTVDINDNEGTAGTTYLSTSLTGSFGAATAGRFAGSFSLALTSSTTQTLQNVFYVVNNNTGPLNPTNAVTGNISSAAVSGTCTAQSCVTFTLPSGTQTIGVTLSGIYTGATIVFQTSTDDTNWSPATCAGSNPLFTCSPSGATYFRAQASAISSGIVTVTIIGDTTEATFAPASSASDPNTLSPVPSCNPSGTTLSSLLYFDTTGAQLFYCTATNTWGQFTGVGPLTVLFVEMDANNQTTGILQLQALP
jgi:hypothetical protein